MSVDIDKAKAMKSLKEGMAFIAICDDIYYGEKSLLTIMLEDGMKKITNGKASIEAHKKLDIILKDFIDYHMRRWGVKNCNNCNIKR